MDKQLLRKTLEVQTCSEDETRMTAFITTFLSENNIDYDVDEEGNISVTKGDAEIYPCICSHIDTVHDIYQGWEVVLKDDVYTSYADNAKKDSPKVQVGIGGDDKVGVFIALQLLLDIEKIKAVFFSREEIGCIGSGAFDIDFFSNTSFALQCDRRGGDEVINNDSYGQLCSNDFLNEIAPYMEKYNYVTGSGVYTDVSNLKGRGIDISVANIGCGYYRAHSRYEYIVESEVINCYNFVNSIFSDEIITNKKQEHNKESIDDYDDYFDYVDSSRKRLSNLAYDETYIGTDDEIDDLELDSLSLIKESIPTDTFNDFKLTIQEFIEAGVPFILEDKTVLFWNEESYDYEPIEFICGEVTEDKHYKVEGSFMKFNEGSIFLAYKTKCPCCDDEKTKLMDLSLTLKLSEEIYECAKCGFIVSFQEIANNKVIC